MALVDLLQIIQSHGLSLPQEVEVKIEDAGEKRWKTVKKITTAMIRALAEDFESQKRTGLYEPAKLGWRNKYNIHQLSKDENGNKVSHRQLYGTTIIDDLCQNDFLEIQEATSKWGGQKFEYRLNLDFLPISDFLIESVRLFIEGVKE